MKLYKTKVFNKEVWDIASKEGFIGLQMEVQTEIKASGDKYHAVFSTAVEDRHGEIVYQNFDLKAFKKNPVYLDSHNYNSIEHILGKIHNIKVKDNKLEGDIEWAMDNPKGLLAKKLADGGFLNTSSIGFIPKEFDEKGNIVKSEIIEISAVSVPANPEALLERVKENEQPTENIGEIKNNDSQEGEGNSEEEWEEDIKEELIIEELDELEKEKEEELPIKEETPMLNEEKKEEMDLESSLEKTLVIEDVKGQTTEDILRAFIQKEKEIREQAVNEIAKHVQKIKEENETKRIIFKSLRDLLSKDIASF